MTGVQTCALPISQVTDGLSKTYLVGEKFLSPYLYEDVNVNDDVPMMGDNQSAWSGYEWDNHREIGRASCRERV